MMTLQFVSRLILIMSLLPVCDSSLQAEEREVIQTDSDSTSEDSLVGRLVLQDAPQLGVPNTKIRFLKTEDADHQGRIEASTNHKGFFICEKPEFNRYLFAQTTDGKHGLIEIYNPENKTVDLKLKPLMLAGGRLLTEPTGKPIANARIDIGYRLALKHRTTNPTVIMSGREVKTFENGTFLLTGLVPDWEYEIFVVTNPYEKQLGQLRYKRIGNVILKESDLGDIPDLKIPADTIQWEK